MAESSLNNINTGSLAFKPVSKKINPYSQYNGLNQVVSNENAAIDFNNGVFDNSSYSDQTSGTTYNGSADYGLGKLGNIGDNINYDYGSIKPTTTTTNEDLGWFGVGDKGTSKFSSTMGGIGAGVGALSGLGSMYLGMKNYKLAKEANELEKDKYNRLIKEDEAADANKAKFAENVGGGATYVG